MKTVTGICTGPVKPTLAGALGQVDLLRSTHSVALVSIP